MDEMSFVPGPLMPKILATLTLLATLVAAPALAATGGDPVTVRVNMARVLRINTPAATVIVGNPGVADVTIQDPQTLVLTGKTFGQTNLIVLDAAGNPVADTTIAVIQDQGDLVTVFSGTLRNSYSCTESCGPTVVFGDSSAYGAEVVQSLGNVNASQN